MKFATSVTGNPWFTAVPNKNHWIHKHDNDHLGKTPDDVAWELTSRSRLRINEQRELGDYTISSKLVNRELIQSHKNLKVDKQSEDYRLGLSHNIELYKHIHRLDTVVNNNRIDTHLHAYSGVSFDPEEHVNYNGFMHSPAFISATVHKGVACHFATGAEKLTANRHGAIQHIIHFHIKPHDRVTPIVGYSEMPSEHEVLIGREATLKHHSTSEHIAPSIFKYKAHPETKLRVHHMTIV